MGIVWRLRYRLLRSQVRRRYKRGKPRREEKDMPLGYSCEYIDRCNDTNCRDCPACGRVK